MGGMTPTPFRAVRLESLSVGPMDNVAYLLTDTGSGSRLLIDAAAEPDRLLALLGDRRLDLVVTTHRHPDHIGALAAVVAATGAATAAGDDDAAAIEQATGVHIDRRLHHGDVLTLAEHRLEVVALRGHTPGSIALVWSPPDGPVHLFTGDSLFPGGVGNTGHDPERFARLLGDVRERLFDRFDDGTLVHPGHGAPTTLGRERPHLPAWAERGW